MVAGIHRIGVFSYTQNPAPVFKTGKIKKGPVLFRAKSYNFIKTIGSVKNFSQISLQALGRMKSASYGGVLQNGLQVFHVHVLFVAP